MAQAARRQPAPKRETLVSGPFKGVRQTLDPYDDDPEYLNDLVNGYIPDVAFGSGAYARPGFALMNLFNQLGGANHMGQGIYQHTAADKTLYNFIAISGKLYRVSADLTVYTDVTPVGITISGALSTRVKMLTFADKLIVSDGVNRPWFGTNLSSTPITGTQIQYDVGNSLWNALDMTEYSGALVFLVGKVAGVSLQTTIAWSAPNDPTSGYFNTVAGVAVDYTWILTQTGSNPIYAIWGTNVALFYFRDDSIGALYGPIGPSFKSNATHDAVDFKIGTQSPASIAQHGNTIFFADTFGRPQMWRIGNPLQDIWKQLRSTVEQSRTDVPQSISLTACSAMLSIANLNLWAVALWSTAPTINLAPTTLYVFDVGTGTYMGRWIIGPGVSVEAMGTLKDQNGETELVVVGSKVSPGANGFGGYVWRLTNPQEASWLDNGALPTIQAQTGRLGYAANQIRNADQCTVITGSPAPCSITLLSASTLQQSFLTDHLITESGDRLVTLGGDRLTSENKQQVTSTPALSLDNTYRVRWGLDIQGRGFNLTINPAALWQGVVSNFMMTEGGDFLMTEGGDFLMTETATPTTQWRLYRVELTTVASMAGPEEV